MAQLVASLSGVVLGGVVMVVGSNLARGKKFTTSIGLVYSLYLPLKRTNIRNRHDQAPHLTQDTSGKVISSQLDITNESKEASPFPAGDHKASINRRARKHNKNKT